LDFFPDFFPQYTPSFYLYGQAGVSISIDGDSKLSERTGICQACFIFLKAKELTYNISKAIPDSLHQKPHKMDQRHKLPRDFAKFTKKKSHWIL